jgi:hypothetical protein
MAGRRLCSEAEAARRGFGHPESARSSPQPCRLHLRLAQLHQFTHTPLKFVGHLIQRWRLQQRGQDRHAYQLAVVLHARNYAPRSTGNPCSAPSPVRRLLDEGHGLRRSPLKGPEFSHAKLGHFGVIAPSPSCSRWDSGADVPWDGGTVRDRQAVGCGPKRRRIVDEPKSKICCDGCAEGFRAGAEKAPLAARPFRFGALPPVNSLSR